MSANGNETGFSLDGSSMEQVRDLLFGTQFKELELRLQRQEERFQREISDARDALKQRLDSLENFMKSETASLLGRIGTEKSERENAFKDAKRDFDEAMKSEQRERIEAVRDEQRERAEAIKGEQRERTEGLALAAKELASTAETFERKLSSVSSTLDNAERELRQLLLVESSSLSEKIEEKYQQALEVIRTTAEQIRHDMVYRSALSGMFTETAVKLSGRPAGDIADVRAKQPQSSTAPAETENARRKGGKESEEGVKNA